MRPERTGRPRGNPGSLNFRARSVPACQGHRPRRTPASLAFALRRLLPSALCQGVGVLKFWIFRDSYSWPVVPPVNASYPALRLCPHDSEPVWLATPSVRLFHSLHLAGSVLTHRVDATTRHPHFGSWLAPFGSLLVPTENKAVAGGRKLMGSRRALYGALRVNVLIHRGLREKAELGPLLTMHAASGVCPAHIRCLSDVAGCVQQYASQRP